MRILFSKLFQLIVTCTRPQNVKHHQSCVATIEELLCGLHMCRADGKFKKTGEASKFKRFWFEFERYLDEKRLAPFQLRILKGPPELLGT